MAFQQSDLDAINKAISSGVMEVQFQDRRKRYQDMAGLLRAKADIEAELSKTGGQVVVRQIRPVIGRGW